MSIPGSLKGMMTVSSEITSMSLSPRLLGALAWSRVPGLGPGTLKKLLQTGWDLLDLWEAPEKMGAARLNSILPPVVKGSDLIALWLQSRETLEPEALWQELLTLNITPLFYGQPGYPAILETIHQPPALLYARGNPALLASSLFPNQALGVVGTRRATDYGRSLTREMIEGLKDSGLVIVSGLAEGIDAAAHQAALEAGLPTVAVFGCGIDRAYPASNRELAVAILQQGGVCLSEYPPGGEPKKENFPKRNRIIAGLSWATLMVEGPAKSGAMITARLALDENRTVLAVPGDVNAIGSEGPLELIRQGASPVWLAEHLLAERPDYGPPVKQTKTEKSKASAMPLQSVLPGLSPLPTSLSSPPLSSPAAALEPDLEPELQALYRALSAKPLALEALAAQTGLSVAVLSGQLTLLELEGLVVLEPGPKVRRV